MTLNFKSLTIATVSIAITLGTTAQFSNAIAGADGKPFAQNPINTRIAQSNSDIEKLNKEAISLYQSGKYREAIPKFEQLLTICRARRDRKNEGTTLQNLGLVYQSLGQYQKAINYYIQSLSINKEIGDHGGEGTTFDNLGTSYNSLGQYQKAIEYYTQSLLISKEIGDRGGEGDALNNLGNVYQSIGQYQKAIEYFTQSLSIYKEAGNRSSEATTLNNLGLVYDFLGQYQKAIKYFTQSLPISKEVGNRKVESSILNNLGLVYRSLGQYQKAIEYHTQSLSIIKEIGDREGEGIILNNLGNGYGLLGQYQKAIEYFTQSLSINKELGNRHSEGVSLGSLGFTYRSLGQYQKAIEYHTQSLLISKEIGDRAGEGTTLRNLGQTYYDLKKLPDAEKFLRQSIAIAESLKVGLKDNDKISFGETIADTYKLLQKVLVEQGKPQEALEISERARSRALAELLASKVNTISSTAQAKIRQAPSLTKIQQIAKQKNTTLVQYSLIDDKIYIWVVAPTGKISFKQTKLPANTKIKDLIVATRDSIGANRGRNRSKDDSKPQVKSDLKLLHKLLIAPIAQELPKDPNAIVTILPVDDLLIVPFAALQDAQDKYLIEQHTITIAPSIQVLGLTTSNANKNGTPLIVGNPIMPLFKGEQLANLQGAETEARAIGEILKTQPLIGAAAEKKEVVRRMQTASLIHLATHGFFIQVEGELPGAVALTNGFLTSDEVFDMQLQADLVVLSACDTGRGDITGDGVIGLSRSLVVAGVPSVMVSLWEVSDEATKVLMEEFYQQLWVKKLPKAQALRQAMLKTKQQFSDPNLWGAFMLVGEGR